MDELVRQHYSREYTIRRNPHTVHISTHYNQLIDCASGEYFVLLADDDEISPTFVSKLLQRLDDHADAHVAIGRQEILDESGNVIRRSKGVLPDVMDGFEFMQAAWKDCRYRYECFATTVARTESLRQNGGYPPFHRGTHNDDAVLVKLALQGPVVFSNECTFRWRVYPTSHGWSLPLRDLARDSSQFLGFPPTAIHSFFAHQQETITRVATNTRLLGRHDMGDVSESLEDDVPGEARSMPLVFALRYSGCLGRGSFRATHSGCTGRDQ